MRASPLRSVALTSLSLAVSLAAGCTSRADKTTPAADPASADNGSAQTPSTPETPETPETPKTPEAKVVVSVASVQLFEDCPETKPEAKAVPAKAAPAAPAADAPGPALRHDGKMAARAKRRPGDAPLRQPCTQSTAQLSVKSTAEDAATVSVTGIRLRLADGKDTLSEVSFRDPKIWAEDTYKAWDGAVAPKAEVKASYNLGLPDWNAVEKAVGGSSFGPMYILEFDVTIDGTTQTLMSTPVPRERPARVVT